MQNPLQLSLQTFKKGSYIIVEGKREADFFYIIKSGKVRVSKEVELVEEESGNILSPGDFFGVVSTMSSHSRIETAQALTDCALICVHRDQYGLLIERNTPVAMKIIQQFSQRMRYLDEVLTEITFKTPASDDMTHLFSVAEYYVRQSQYNQAYYAYYQYIKYCPDGENIKYAKERMAKIKPYAKTVFLDGDNTKFTRDYPKDTMIFSESQPGNELYIIQKGSVKITKILNGNEQMLALLKPGDIFGEMALLENKPRSASAIAHEDTVLMAVNIANFKRMAATQPQIISKLTKLLSERIWFVYQQIANTQISDPLGRLYDALLLQLEKHRIAIDNNPHTFDLGPQELINLIGLQKSEGSIYLRKLLENPKVKLANNKIHIDSTKEVEYQSRYYRKMESLGKSRKKGDY